MTYKLGSLFDGSGGFPLAGVLCGVEPCWASEVEPYPIAVTRSRFPNMKHVGDISKVNGAEVEPVDIITFGSPCQDLSVAGKGAGIKHEDNGDEETTRSGLFMEAVRIIKEMKEATNGLYPTFALWENVPGAFSSNKGEDFRVVLEELIKIVEPRAVMPAVPKRGWAYADSYIGDEWSLAYRTFDAQYWGVPQRRRRVHLVLDLRGQRAREVLFEREGVRGYFTQGRTPWQGIASGTEDSAGANDRKREADNRRGLDTIAYSMQDRAGKPGGGKGFLVQENRATSLRTSNYQYLFQPVSDILLDDQGGQQISVRTDGKAPILSTDSRNYVCTPIPIHDKATRYKGGGPTRSGDGAGNGLGVGKPGDPMNTLTAGDRHAVAYPPETAYGLDRGDQEAFSGDCHIIEERPPQYIARRLTPTECARLQGFADSWGDIEEKTELSPEEYEFWLEVRNTHAAINGKQVKDYTEKQMLTWYNKLHTDGAEYKMWGNGIALPPALYCMQGITEVLERDDVSWLL